MVTNFKTKHGDKEKGTNESAEEIKYHGEYTHVLAIEAYTVYSTGTCMLIRQ